MESRNQQVEDVESGALTDLTRCAEYGSTSAGRGESLRADSFRRALGPRAPGAQKPSGSASRTPCRPEDVGPSQRQLHACCMSCVPRARANGRLPAAWDSTHPGAPKRKSKTGRAASRVHWPAHREQGGSGPRLADAWHSQVLVRAGPAIGGCGAAECLRVIWTTARRGSCNLQMHLDGLPETVPPPLRR